ncbi:MAG: hypothetical protein HY702_00700 [Gemmatimonadetes bacterium]|nr:hypothetical protein [Gemmatimonadota bacterium]
MNDRRPSGFVAPSARRTHRLGRPTGSAGSRLAGAVQAFALVLIAVAATPHVQAVAQQEGSIGGRWRVLVVPLQAEGLNARFGETVADMVIEGLKDLPTHAPIPKAELRKACRTYGVRCEELNAITSRQMAAQLKAQVVMFGTVKPDGASYRVDAAFTDVKTGDEIRVAPISVDGAGDAKKAAQALLRSFEDAITFQRARAFCQDYVGSRQPLNAIPNCDRALAINPRSGAVLYNKGTAFRQLAEVDSANAAAHFDSAIAYYRKTLEVQPGYKDALQSLAWVYGRKGDAETALKLYREFLELDPRNAGVRLAVAHDLAQDGLLAQAIGLLNEGIALDSAKTELWQYKGDLSLRLAQDRTPYADTALAAYGRVYAALGAQADTSMLTNMLAAYAQAGRTEEALGFGAKIVETHPGAASLWSQYAGVLARAKRYSEAIRALDHLLDIDANYPNVYVRRGLYRFYSGDEAAARGDFRRAIDRQEIAPQELANNLFAEGYQAFSKEKDLDRAVRSYKVAMEYCREERRCAEFQFFWGYALYTVGFELDRVPDKPENLGTIRRALNLFEEAKTRVERGRAVRPNEAKKILDDIEVFIFREQQRIRQLQRSGG